MDFSIAQAGVGAGAERVVRRRVRCHLGASLRPRPCLGGCHQSTTDALFAPCRINVPAFDVADALRAAKAEGLAVTAGVSINHLSLNENDIGEYRTFFRLEPPLRAEDDRLAMVEALKDGTIDVISSSHDPQDVDGKRVPFADAVPGAIGLETLLGVALRLHHSGDVPLIRLVDALSTAPARLFGLPGGTLKPGADADLIVVDLDRPWTVREADIRSRSKNTCHEGALLSGKALHTMVAGRTIYTEDGAGG